MAYAESISHFHHWNSYRENGARFFMMHTKKPKLQCQVAKTETSNVFLGEKKPEWVSTATGCKET